MNNKGFKYVGDSTLRDEDFLTRDRLPGRPRIYVTVSLPRCGKSTVVNAVHRDWGATIVCRDDIRRSLGCEWVPALEPVVNMIANKMTEALLIRGQSVIFDEINHTERFRRELISLADRHDADIVWVPFAVPDQAELRRRCAKSNFPWSELERLRKEFEPLTAAEKSIGGIIDEWA